MYPSVFVCGKQTTMPNTHGGKNHKKYKKKKPTDTVEDKIIFAEKGTQVYALVKKRLGGTRVEVDCSDNTSRSAVIPGSFYKRVWINPGDILLCDLPPDDINNNKKLCYIRYKYTPSNAQILKSQDEIKFDIGKDKSDHVDDFFAVDSDDDDREEVDTIHMVQANAHLLDLPEDESDNEDDA